MVQGVKIQEDGTRVPCDYGCDRERVWCECYDLHQAGLYEEAYKKLGEYHELNGGLVDKSDWYFILKIELGYLEVKPTEQNFENTKTAWRNAMLDEDNGQMAEFAEAMTDIFIKAQAIPVEYFTKATPEQVIKALYFMRNARLDEDNGPMAEFADAMIGIFIDIFIKAHGIPVEYADFIAATPEQIIRALEFMLSVIQMGNEQWTVDFESTDMFYRFSMGLCALCAKGDEKKALELFEEVKKLSSYRKFLEKKNPCQDEDVEE